MLAAQDSLPPTSRRTVRSLNRLQLQFNVRPLRRNRIARRQRSRIAQPRRRRKIVRKIIVQRSQLRRVTVRRRHNRIGQRPRQRTLVRRQAVPPSQRRRTTGRRQRSRIVPNPLDQKLLVRSRNQLSPPRGRKRLHPPSASRNARLHRRRRLRRLLRISKRSRSQKSRKRKKRRTRSRRARSGDRIRSRNATGIPSSSGCLFCYTRRAFLPAQEKLT